MAESFNYSNESELFQLATKVNNFCVLTPEEFDPDIHVGDAKELVQFLAPRMKASSLIQASVSQRGKQSTFRGATEHGEVSFTDDSREMKTKEFGKTEYRIGNYVVKGYSTRLSRNDRLEFQHFWERERGSRISENPPSSLDIIYKRKTLEPIAITKVEYTTKTIVGPLSVCYGAETPIWQAKP